MKYNLRKGLFLLMAILCVGWVQAQTNTIYVSPSGDDGNQGTTGSPVKTLAKALELATSGGETIQLAEGTYTETTALNISKTVTIQGESGNEKPIISGQTITVSATNGAEVKFENLTLTPNNTNTHAVIVSADAKVSMTNCSLHTCNTGVRMTGESAQLTLENTNIDCTHYAISVRNLNQKVTVSGGTLTGWAAIMTSAGDIGSTGDSKVSISVTGATLQGRTFTTSAGDGWYGVVVLQQNFNGVNLTISNSKLEVIGNSSVTLHGDALKKMNALDIRSYGNTINVSNSTLSATYAENAFHSAVIALGMRPGETPIYADGLTTGTNTLNLTGCTLNGKSGNYLVFSNRTGNDKNTDDLTINETAYSPAAGNICYTAPTTAANLQSKINDAVAGEKIVLTAGTYEIDATLALNKAITIEGAIDENGAPATTLQRKAAWSNTNNDTKHMVNITASNVTLKNLVIDGKGLETGMTPQGSGINVYVASSIKLENVISKNNKGGGLIVNGSNVIAENFHTEGNGYGINLDKGSDVTQSPTLSIDANCSVAESSKIYGPVSVFTENSVIVPTGWITATVTLDQEYKMWTDKVITIIGNEVYANGYPITIESAENEGHVRIFRTAYEKDYIEVEGASATIYGGSRDAGVESTSITLKNTSVRNIFGGGYGLGNKTSGTPANVTKKAEIVIDGGTVSNLLVGSGDTYSHVKEVNISITGNSKVEALIAGGYDAGATTNTIDTDLLASVNGVETVSISIENSEISAMGCGGGQGYSRTGTSTITATNAKIGSLYGTFFNGRADNIKATFTNCTINKELALINRGWVTDADFTFNNCTYGESLYASLAATIGWANSDTPGNPKPTVDGTVKFTFTGDNTPDIHITRGLDLANVELTGAKAIITHFDDITNDTNIEELKDGLNSFTISSGKTWTFNNGLEMTSGVTLNNNGSLSVGGVCKVATDAQLATVLSAEAASIQLTGDSYQGFEINNKSVTINGNKATINGTVTLTGENATLVTLEELKLAPTDGNPAIVNSRSASLTASHNYWGSATPNFATLIGGTGEVSPYPYYNNADMENLVDQLIKVTDATTITEKIYPGCNLEITSTGHATLTQANAHFGTVIINEGGQLTPPTYNAEETGRAIADRFVFNPTLENKWKALGTPFTAQLKNNLGDKADLFEETAETGIWFAGLVDGKPEIEVKKTYTNAGLWAANDKINYGLHAQNVTLESKAEPTAPTSGLQMCVNPNTYDIQLNQSAYVLNKAGTVFELQKNPEIKAFQSFVLADSNTTATLRSIGTTDPNATGNEFVVKEGYYLTTERGAIVVHTAEPMELYVVAVSGAVVYRGTVANGERIAVPTGIYAVNGQMVRVK